MTHRIAVIGLGYVGLPLAHAFSEKYEVGGHCIGVDPAILISDNIKIKNAMNWQPKYDDLEVICQTTLEWEKKI